MDNKLDALHANRTVYAFNMPDARLLEAFPNPMPNDGVVNIVVPEFTSLCPVTGQPDFATIRIVYTPRELCVESKSLKLYMMSYRNHGAFHEACVTNMFVDLVTLLQPNRIKITGEFAPRGGITFWPTVASFGQ